LCAWRGGERECKRESDGVEFPQKKKNEVRGEEGKKLTPQPLVLVSPTGSFFPLHSLSLCVSFREQLSTDSPVRSALTRAQRDRESRDFWENGKEKEEESGPSVPSSARGLPF
jgi:hypothetical protein